MTERIQPSRAMEPRQQCSRVALSIVLACSVATSAIPAFGAPTTRAHASASERPQEPIAPIPLKATVDPDRVALGERLFNDVRLSHGNEQSCASCHPLTRGGMDGRARAVATDDHARLRNTPTIFNVGLSASFNWDGVASTLERHAEMVLLSPNVMNTTWPELLAKLKSDAGYLASFDAAYPVGLTKANVLHALASFERSLLTPDARFDRFLRGELDALSARERHGYRLFKSYGCTACHQGVNIGGNVYQKFGVFEHPGNGDGSIVELGRYRVTGVPRDRWVFRVPSLRNVAVTAPYFHDGRARTLEKAVALMARVQLGRQLTRAKTRLIVQFLQTLTGEYRGQPLVLPPD